MVREAGGRTRRSLNTWLSRRRPKSRLRLNHKITKIRPKSNHLMTVWMKMRTMTLILIQIRPTIMEANPKRGMIVRILKVRYTKCL